MKTGQLVKKYQITRDTLRHYINKGLLSPEKIGNTYYWSLENENDLQNILSLRQLGLSIKVIQKIKESHDKSCGSLDQALSNYRILSEELSKRENKMQKLQMEKDNISKVLQQHKVAINDRKQKET